MMSQRKGLVIGETRIRPGESRSIRLQVSESYAGELVFLPVHVVRARRPGPTLFLTAAIHGDEVNGTGIIHQLLWSEGLELKCGTLIAVPVVNVFGFEHHNRYMPDRRDLNRSFPGSPDGSLASRFAHVIMREIVAHCDCGIDLHSASIRRTNYPNVRADLNLPAVRKIAESFGCELIVDGKGPAGAFRRSACEKGCPTIVLEAGEVAKIEPGVMEIGLRGVKNVLIDLGMLEGEIERPPYQTKVRKTVWVRAQLGGLLRFHVAPGDLVERGQPLASNDSIFGEARSIVIAPVEGIVLGMSTHPAVHPGEPIIHLALPGRRVSTLRRLVERIPAESPEARLRDDLATNVTVAPSPGGGHRGRGAHREELTTETRRATEGHGEGGDGVEG
jgi:hypothetical protein